MNDPKTLRDELAMSAPIPQHATDGSFISEESTDDQIASEIRLRYRYADIALRVKAETMPNEASWPGQDALELAGRISQYLQVGGLFNPEQMEHNKVRDLLIDCRDYLESSPIGEKAR